MKMYDVKDKVVLLTGAAAGIGEGMVKAFLAEGAKHVAALDLDVKSGRQLEIELSKKYGADKIKFHKCDVTTSELEEAFDNVIKEFGYIDVVVNNAGIMNDSPKLYKKEIEINVTALITSSLKAYNLMRKDHGGKGGTIINISSIIGLFQGALLPVYCATKSAVLQFSNCLGMENHFSRSEVRVLALCYGCTDTMLFDTSKFGGIDKETDDELPQSFELFSFQSISSAVKGSMEAFQKGTSGSTWLITTDRPAEDVSNNVQRAYEIMSQGIFDK